MGRAAEAFMRCELEMAQRALKLQTRRCRQLVTEFTRRLQEKEQQIVAERHLRDEQLTKVLRSLLVFESRLKQEQTFLRHELSEKDEVINRQKKELRRLKFTIQFCKTCRQFCHSNDSCDSSSEYYVEGWESGSELASVDDSCRHSSSGEESKTSKDSAGRVFEKNKTKNLDSYKRPKKVPRRTTGTYFDVLKQRETDSSNGEDETKYEVKEQNTNFSTRMDSLHGIRKSPSLYEEKYPSLSESDISRNETKQNENIQTNPFLTPDNNFNTPPEERKIEKVKLISETISVFEGGDDTNENWYASGSDNEDENQRDIYRNNPVLECMNQILLQNINDANVSPPHSPEMDRSVKSKTQKRVKFIDEKDEMVTYVEAIDVKKSELDYYETPIQINNNFYEVPQSIYSNDYEQILSKCGSENSWGKNKENIQENKVNRMGSRMSLVKNNNLDIESKHYYIDMDVKTPSPIPRQEIIKKGKIARTPPALPPKPANLVSKFKMQNLFSKSCENLDNFSVESSEPDYCSISELNLPPSKIILNTKPQIEPSIYDPISLDGPISSLVGKDKSNMQAPKQPQVKNERGNLANIAQINMLKNKKDEISKIPNTEIPKLPQVSEIIIPEEDEKQKEERISQDNYIKNNSQILKQRLSQEKIRSPIIIGTSVSNLISGFNNQFLSEIGIKKPKERLFSNFERQSYEKHQTPKTETPNFEKFDLSQNFEEFNLDDCEIGEDFQSEPSDSLNYINTIEPKENLVPNSPEPKQEHKIEKPKTPEPPKSDQKVPKINVTPPNLTLQQLQKNLSIARQLTEPKQPIYNSEPSYEHFLECTGLSSKSILTPSRMLSNHKSMLKPKDIKLRSKFKSAVFEHSGGTIKYWSEPYL